MSSSQSGTPLPVAEVFTTKTHDVAMALTGCGLGAACAWAAVAGLGDGAAPEIHKAGLTLLSGGIAVWALCMGVGGVWRLAAPGPALTAGPDGLSFHPSIGPRRVPWREVRSIRWIARRPGELEVTLEVRAWSFWNWTMSRAIRINHTALGLSWKQAAALVQTMRSERGLAADPGREPNAPPADDGGPCNVTTSSY